MSGYDLNLLVKQCGSKNEKLQVIDQNKEKCIFFTKLVHVSQSVDAEGKIKHTFMRVQFVNSFLAFELFKLGESLTDEQCAEIRRHFPVRDQF